MQAKCHLNSPINLLGTMSTQGQICVNLQISIIFCQIIGNNAGYLTEINFGHEQVIHN